MRRRRRDRTVADADQQRRDNQHGERVRGSERDHQRARRRKKNPELGYANRAEAFNEAAARKTREHCARIDQSDENADPLRRNGECLRDLRRQNRRRRGSERYVDLNRCRRSERHECAPAFGFHALEKNHATRGAHSTMRDSVTIRSTERSCGAAGTSSTSCASKAPAMRGAARGNSGSSRS